MEIDDHAGGSGLRQRVRALLSGAAESGRQGVIGGGRRLGFDIVRSDYYSPIPDLAKVPESAWTEPSAMAGLAFDLDRQMDYLERELAPFIAEFDPPRKKTADRTQFFLHNNMYESVDAETLYGLLRKLRPKQIVELGSGRSTQVIGAARARNEADGAPSTHYVGDPFPNALTRELASGSYTLDAIGATEIPIERFTSLAADDVLFVDTTHTVKFAGEVTHLILEVLPRLAPGVVVHFHDIFLPWPYPRAWLEASRRFWAEQYLLQAFLSFNSDFETLLANHALALSLPDRLQRVIPSFAPGVKPGGYWLRRVG
jgi:Methyltransferase domain